MRSISMGIKGDGGRELKNQGKKANWMQLKKKEKDRKMAPNFKFFCPYATGKKKRERKIQERKKKKEEESEL